MEFSLDLAGCYPAEAKCRKWRRTFLWEKSAGRLTLSDDYELEEPGTVESVLICLDEPNLQVDGVLVAGLRIRFGSGSRYLGAEKCPYRDHYGEDAHVYRLRFAPESGQVIAGRLSLEVTLAE